MSELITTERRGRVLIARIANPPYELMNDPIIEALSTLIARVDSDPAIGAVVLTGTHPERFVTHYDVDELLRASSASPAVNRSQARLALAAVRTLACIPGLRRLLAATPAAGILQLQKFHDVLLRIGRSGTVFIAAINGRTAGGGLELALACDLRYLSDRGGLSQPEVCLGFPPGGGGTQRLARLIGRAAALEMLLTGRVVDADEALRLGLVNGVFAHDTLLDAVLRQAEPLARRYKPGVAAIKRAVLEGGSLSLEHGLHVEQAGFLAMLGEERPKAAMAAYIAHTEQSGDVPAYDPAVRKTFEAGEFIDMTGTGSDR